MTLDVDRLVSVAMQLAGRVRDEDPDANRRWLHACTTAEEREALLYVLAAAVPVDVEASTLYGWVREVQLRPHGTPAAVRRHNYHHEPLCGPCKVVEAERKRVQRRVALLSKTAAMNTDQVSGRQRALQDSGGDGRGGATLSGADHVEASAPTPSRGAA